METPTDTYTNSEFLEAMMQVIQTNLPLVVQVAVYLSVVGFILNWLFFSIRTVTESPFKRGF